MSDITMSDINDKHYILEDKLRTWMERDINGVKINPVIRNQNELSKIGCVHHALCPLLETVQKKLDPTDDHTVDIRWLLRTFPPPATAKKLVDALLDQDIHRGSIKASNIEAYPFQISDAKCYDISESAPQRKKSMRKVVEHLVSKGPVIGSFYPDVDYDPARDGIYVTKNDPVVRNCLECDREIRLSHAVCVVGKAMGMVDGEKMPCFQYLESNDPLKYSGREDGICYMTIESMDSITIIV